MILSKCTICGNKKSRFIKNQEAKGLLSNLGVRKPLSTNTRWNFVLICMLNCIKMNEIVNVKQWNSKIVKFLLAGDKCMPEMHLKQTGFTYSACGRFTRNKERIQKVKERGDTSYFLKKWDW